MTSTKVKIGSLEVPPIAVGTAQWGGSPQGRWGWNDDSFKNAKEAYEFFEKNGVGFYDTAELYGESEVHISQFRTSDTIVTTKFMPSKDRSEQYPDIVTSALKNSLARLKMDSVPLYQVHSPLNIPSYEKLIIGLKAVIDAGLTKEVGLSNYSLEQLKEVVGLATKHGIKIASLQLDFSLLRTLPISSGIIPYCHENNIAILAYSPLSRGMLTDKYDLDIPESMPQNRGFERHDLNKVKQLLGVLRDLTKKYNVSVGNVATNWVICKGAIPIIGAKDLEQAKQAIGCLGFRLTQDEVAQLDKYASEGSVDAWRRG